MNSYLTTYYCYIFLNVLRFYLTLTNNHIFCIICITFIFILFISFYFYVLSSHFNFLFQNSPRFFQNHEKYYHYEEHFKSVWHHLICKYILSDLTEIKKKIISIFSSKDCTWNNYHITVLFKNMILTTVSFKIDR